MGTELEVKEVVMNDIVQKNTNNELISNSVKRVVRFTDKLSNNKIILINDTKPNS